MAHFYEEDVGIDWIEFPIPIEDRIGYQRLAERMEVPLALGSSFDHRDDFRRVMEKGEIRVLRPDVLRLGNHAGSKNCGTRGSVPCLGRALSVAGNRRSSCLRPAQRADGRIGWLAGIGIRGTRRSQTRKVDTIDEARPRSRVERGCDFEVLRGMICGCALAVATAKSNLLE